MRHMHDHTAEISFHALLLSYELNSKGRILIHVVVQCWQYVTGSEKIDHSVIMQFVQYGIKVLPRSGLKHTTM